MKPLITILLNSVIIRIVNTTIVIVITLQFFSPLICQKMWTFDRCKWGHLTASERWTPFAQWRDVVTSYSEECNPSSFYWASVANAPNVLQPCWLIVLHLDVPDLTASPLLWLPSGQTWRCLWTFLFSNVPTFATGRLQEILAAKFGTTWARNGRWILPENVRIPRNIQGSYSCLKSTT